MRLLTSTFTYVFCPACGYRLERCSDDEDTEDYYECYECGTEWDLDGFERKR